MPHLSLALLQVVVLLAAVPAQYLLSRWIGVTPGERDRTAQRLLSVWGDWRRFYLNGTVWADWLREWASKVWPLSAEDPQLDPVGESPALEVLLHDNNMGYFGASREVRQPRAAYVLHRVGQVVMERRRNMVGVIVSWDVRLRAPPQWTSSMYSPSELSAVEDTPHYKVIFPGPAPSSLMVGYLPQSSLKPITGFQPDIPTLDHYFSHYDGERFVMRQWLQDLFPED